METQSQGNLDAVKDGEIAGIDSASNGRNCAQHSCCGATLEPDHLVTFRSVTVQDEDGILENAVVAIRISDGTETCKVGFLPRRLAKFKKENYENKFAQIIEIYKDSEELVLQRKAKRLNGVASFRMLTDIPRSE